MSRSLSFEVSYKFHNDLIMKGKKKLIETGIIGTDSS